MSLSLRNCEIMQELELYSIDKLKEKLAGSKGISKYAFIVHDKDDTRAHFHCMIAFNSPTPAEQIASYFDIAPQYINKIKSRWSNAISYLVHKNNPEKFQYDTSLVVSNYDFSKDIVENVDYIGKIVKGEIREYQLDLIDPYYYVKHAREIKNAFEFRQQIVFNERKNRNMVVYFIQGDTGTGKSSYAVDICDKMNWSFCRSSGSNDPLQDYKGEDCLILDDFRDNVFRLVDALKLLDPYHTSSSNSRYHNKFFNGVAIIITSSVPLDLWYRGESVKDEDRNQFLRRISCVITMTMNEIISSVGDVEYVAPNTFSSLNRKSADDLKAKFLGSLGMKPRVDISLTDDSLKDVSKSLKQLGFEDFNGDDLPFNK